MIVGETKEGGPRERETKVRNGQTERAGAPIRTVARVYNTKHQVKPPHITND